MAAKFIRLLLGCLLISFLRSTDGEILVQQHIGGTDSFKRPWADFKAGFGERDGDYWIGNDRLHELTQLGIYKLRFDIQSANNDEWYWAEYDSFAVGNESSGYLLEIAGYSGTAEDAISGYGSDVNGMKFTTSDRDNDKQLETNCASTNTYINGGFWHNSCTRARVNSVDGTINGFSWGPLPDGGSGQNNLRYSKMALIEREGAILVQQHIGATESFKCSWAAFKSGFGQADGDYWIGNDRLHELTKSGRYKMRFDVQSSNNDEWYHAEYTTFIVGDEDSGYQLEVGGYDGTAGDAMTDEHNLNGMKFTTQDRDNDEYPSNCATETAINGGFWHKACSRARINSANDVTNGFSWNVLPDGGNGQKNLRTSRMSLICRSDADDCEPNPCENGGRCVDGVSGYTCV